MEIPAPPLVPVWVKPQAGHGETVPGIVLGWSRDHIRSALDSGWVLTVAVIPFEGALLVDFVRAERVVPVRDATPLEPTASTPGTAADPAPDPGVTQAVPGTPLRGRRRRHVWVDGADQTSGAGSDRGVATQPGQRLGGTAGHTGRPRWRSPRPVARRRSDAAVERRRLDAPTLTFDHPTCRGAHRPAVGQPT